MTSKKTASHKQVKLPRLLDYTKQFLKDYQRLTQSGRYDMRRLKEAMLLIMANDGPLAQEWRDHPLSGQWNGYRECHVGGDFLLVYRIHAEKTNETIVFARCGTHAEIFK